MLSTSLTTLAKHGSVHTLQQCSQYIVRSELQQPKLFMSIQQESSCCFEFWKVLMNIEEAVEVVVAEFISFVGMKAWCFASDNRHLSVNGVSELPSAARRTTPDAAAAWQHQQRNSRRRPTNVLTVRWWFRQLACVSVLSRQLRHPSTTSQPSPSCDHQLAPFSDQAPSTT